MFIVDIVSQYFGNNRLLIPTIDEVNSYIEDVTASEQWGKNAYSIVITPEVLAVPAVLDDENNVVTPAIEEVPAVTQGIAAEWSYTVTDITAQYNFDQAVIQALVNQNTGAAAVATVAAINESKLAAGTLTQQTFNALLVDQNILSIERLLWNGALTSAKALIQSTNLTMYYTTDEIASIIKVLP